MIKRLLALTLALLATGTLFASGAAESTGPVTVRVFNGKAEAVDWLNGVIAKFNAANPGIKVVQEFQKDASSMIKVKLASGDVPEIVTVYGQDYADQGLYADLSGQSAWWNRLSPAIKELVTDLRSGKQYRIATNMTMAGLYTNKAIFAELGLKEASTWDEFVANLRVIKAKKPGVAPLFVGGKESWMIGHLIEFLAHGVIKQKYGNLGSRKAFLDNDQTKLDFATPGGSIETLAKGILQLRDEGLVNSDFLTATYDNQIEAFATGKAAMISQGMWALGGILEKNPGFKDIGFSPYPALLPGTKPVILSAEDSGYSIMAKSAHPLEAKKFLDFLFTADNQKAYSEFLKSPSAFKDVSADWGPLKGEVSAALKKGVNIGFTTEAPAGFSGDDAGRLVQALYAGQIKTPADFAKAYKDAWDKAWQAGHQ
jgi:raffinose/stachyose/melibiose transport system substrate-binding protein